MLLKEILDSENAITDVSTSKDKDFSVFLEDKNPRHTLKKALVHSVALHIGMFILLYVLAKSLMFIMMLLGIDLDLFNRPKMKMRDIEFVFVLPEKYDIKKSFKLNAKGKSYSLAGPSPNNRPYNGDEGSLKSNTKDKSVPKDRVVNKKPVANTKQAASQTTTPLSKTPKKGSYVPPIEEPEVFTANIPNAEDKINLGWGKQGTAGFHSPNAGNATFKASGEGTGGSGTGDSVGNGTASGGGYYYGSAGAPRPQSANSYKNEGLDVDLRPYVTELQRRVLRNWNMPANDNSKKTVLFLRIAKNGNLMILNIKTPSGDTHIDELAINAVKKAQPFNPLPAGYRNAYADVIMTFDYNVTAKAN